MKLREYLFKKKMTMLAFAREIEYNPVYLRSVIAGRLDAGEKLMRAVERKTEGMVKGHEIQDEKEE